jgi:hypothetical protein
MKARHNRKQPGCGRVGRVELGTHYRVKRDGEQVIDDTGHSIRLAEMAASGGDLSGAAAALSGVLQTRLEMYARVFRGTIE